MAPTLDIRPMQSQDVTHVIHLHQTAFGPGRFARTAYRVREANEVSETGPSTCSRVGWVGKELAAAVSMTDINVGGQSGAQLLGPLVVAPKFAGNGLGQPMIEAVLDCARNAHCQLVVLVGDVAYYKRFGFEVVPPGHITLPGPVDDTRVLYLEMSPGALAKFSGVVAT